MRCERMAQGVRADVLANLLPVAFHEPMQAAHREPFPLRVQKQGAGGFVGVQQLRAGALEVFHQRLVVFLKLKFILIWMLMGY